MDKLEELLPGIEEFLTKALAGERLSDSAEKKRQYYSERLDVLKLAFPPTLPPRNDGDDFIAQQRELARIRGPLAPPSQDSENFEFEDGKDYDPVDTRTTLRVVKSTTTSAPSHLATMEDDLLYEEPVDLTDNTPSQPFDDMFSDTSYESYDDEEDPSGLYVNQDFHDDPNRDPVLPSSKKKKKKKGTPARCLMNVTFSGELYTKVKWSWSKRYCLIKDGRLMSFKSENAHKAQLDCPLDGYDIMYVEKEAKRSHVIRISRPACETLFYSGDTKEKVDQWLEVLTMASCGGSGGSVTTSGFCSAASSSPKVDKEVPSTDAQTAAHNDSGVRKSSSLTDLSMTSEGSSGDGTIGQPKTTPDDKKLQKSDRKASKPILVGLSTFFGTLSKKKGEKPKIKDADENVDPEANVCGYLTVYSELMSSKKWNRRWCVVKQSILTIFKDIGEDADFSLPLPGCEVVSACDPKRKMAMRIMEEGKEKIILDMPDTVAQGQWLNVLIRETGCAEGKSRFPSNNGHSGYEEEEDIYCDVDDDHDLLESWNLPKEWSLKSDSSSTSDTLSRPSEKDSEENKKPPPLPSGPPPGVTLAKYLKKAHTEQNGQNRANRRTSIKRPTEAPPSIPVPRRENGESKEVVKGHSGRTIEEDMDILVSTKNPILSELRRKGRPSSGSSGGSPIRGTSSSSTLTRTKALTSTSVDSMGLDKVDDNIDDTKRKLASIKKKRAEIRSRKLGCTDIEEKLRHDDKLRDLLRDQDNAEANLAKLQLKQAELQALERKARLELESQARKDSLTRLERQGSFKSLEKDSLTRFESGEWDLITRRTSGDRSEDENSLRQSGTSTPRSNGSSPLVGRKGNSLDRGGTKTVTLNTKNGIGGPGTGSLRGRNTRYTSDLTGRTTRNPGVSRTASMSSATRPESPRGLRISTSKTEEEDELPSPRGGRKQVQERLKLWENISGAPGSSNC